MTDPAGTMTSIPRIPMALPPMVTATNTQIPGDHFRINEVPLDLLEHLKQYEEPQSLNGIVDEDQQRPHNTTHNGSENGDQSQKCNQHRDHQRIGEPEEQHAHKEHGA